MYWPLIIPLILLCIVSVLLSNVLEKLDDESSKTKTAFVLTLISFFATAACMVFAK